MKRKSLIALTTGLFSFAAIALSGSLILNNSGFLRSFVAHGEPDQGSYTITAADFPVSGNGSISVGGETWNYEGATISGSTVSISGVFYTNSYSGADAADAAVLCHLRKNALLGGYRGDNRFFAQLCRILLRNHALRHRKHSYQWI